MDPPRQSYKRKFPDPDETQPPKIEPFDEPQLDDEYEDDEIEGEESLVKQEQMFKIALKSQEPTTSHNLKITPFNMTEELEEGHFDAHGNYIFSKPQKPDNWVDSIDWDAVETKDVKNTPTEDKEAPPTEFECYRNMLRIMIYNETVEKCIKRLGKVRDKQDIKHKLNVMIELAHQRVEAGDLDIYQKSYENLEEAINSN